MYLKEYFEKYDELMNLVYSEETDRIIEDEMEAQLRMDLLEEEMWYKHEDYMLWNNKPLEDKLADSMPYKLAVSITVFAVERDLQDDDINSILDAWSSYIALSLKLGYPLDMICDTVLYNAVTNHGDYGELADKAESVFCQDM